MRQTTSCGVSKWKEYQCNLFKLLKTVFGSTQSKVRAKRGQRSYLQGYNVDIVEDYVEVRCTLQNNTCQRRSTYLKCISSVFKEGYNYGIVIKVLQTA